MRDVPTTLSMEEYVVGVVQKLRNAVMKDVPRMQRQEECVSGMEQQLRGVVMKDAPILFSKEEFVSDMVQNLRGAQVKRYMGMYQIHGFREEFVSDMVLKLRSPILVLVKDVTSCCLILSIFKIIRYACREISINKYNMHTRMVP